jgi:hypothetical protein
LAELLITMGVLVVLVLLFTQLLNSAATISTLGHKRMDADSQARQLLDRMAIDVDQMLKRNDVDYFAKRTAAPNSTGGAMNGNDQIAFYSTVPGYYPPTGSQSPISLVAYRVNSDSAKNKLERLGKGLVWNGVSTDSSLAPIVFLPFTISAMWPYATNQNSDSGYEVFGPDIFRFEYYYLLKGLSTAQPAIFSDTPWDARIPGHASVSGMRDVAAIVVAIAVIDFKSKALFTDPDSDIAALAAQLADYNSVSFPRPGQLLTNWRSTIDANTSLPRSAISGIRLYERYFDLTQ